MLWSLELDLYQKHLLCYKDLFIISQDELLINTKLNNDSTFTNLKLNTKIKEQQQNGTQIIRTAIKFPELIKFNPQESKKKIDSTTLAFN